MAKTPTGSPAMATPCSSNQSLPDSCNNATDPFLVSRNSSPSDLERYAFVDSHSGLVSEFVVVTNPPKSALVDSDEEYVQVHIHEPANGEQSTPKFCGIPDRGHRLPRVWKARIHSFLTGTKLRREDLGERERWYQTNWDLNGFIRTSQLDPRRRVLS